MRRALVVAHPDDESLWFGGIVLAEPGDWTIVCCSIPERDPIRAWKFFDACDVLRAKPRLLPFPDKGADTPLEGLDALDLGSFDQVVTHGAAGEYGHRHHLQLHRFVKERCGGRILFGCYGGAPGEIVIDLDASGLYRRKALALKAYDHRSPSDGGMTKSEALLARYGGQFDLDVESYARA